MTTAIALKCNSRLCNYTVLQGRGYRTKCGHIFCEDCAIKIFSNSNYCAVCNAELQEGQVSEFLIGITTGPISRYMYQSSFQSNDWGDTLNNVRNVLKATLDLVIWTLHQLHFEAAKNSERVSILHNQNEQQRQSSMNVALQLKSSTIASEHRIRELEQQLKDHDRNAATLHENLTEKSKKCDAWERAYNLIRQARASDNKSDEINAIDSAEALFQTNNTLNSSAPVGCVKSSIASKSGFMTPPKIQGSHGNKSSSQLNFPSSRPLTSASSPEYEMNPSRIVRRRTEMTTVRYAEGFDNKSDTKNNLNEDFVPKLRSFVSRSDSDPFDFPVRSVSSRSDDDTLQRQSSFVTAKEGRPNARSSFFSHRA